MLIPRSLRRFHCNRRAASALFVFIVALFLLATRPDIRDLSFLSLPEPAIPEDAPGAWDNHPVVVLHKRAQQAFDALVQRQSTTPLEAETEYSRRYGTNPPPGFQQWVEYALAHKSPIIDDFDTISRAVHRFSNLSAAEFTGRMLDAAREDAGAAQHGRVDKCTYDGARFDEGCRHFAKHLNKLLGDARPMTPRVEFLINFLDEPSILPTEEGAAASSVLPWDDRSHRSIAGVVAEACKHRGPATPRPDAEASVPTFGLPFVQDVAAAKDLCQHPEYESAHGFISSPVTMKHMRTDLPMLSQVAPYPFSDILYPSTHYGIESSLYSRWDDRPWHRKKNAVYWAGSSTGGFWSHETWRHGHRQRLAILGMHKEERDFTYLRSSTETSAGVQPYTTNEFDKSRFDITMTKIVGSESNEVRDEQTSYFEPPKRLDSETRPFAYRLVLDVDGNSYSGRFYRFLASQSVPLKVSLFREWHDERLIPWLHYIPVSMSMDELPELVRFLTRTAEGQRIASRVAEAGREWYFQAMTPVHHGIYLYRLMLEMAWMQNATRAPG